MIELHFKTATHDVVRTPFAEVKIPISNLAKEGALLSFERLFQFINKCVAKNLSLTEKELIMHRFKFKALRKGQCFLQEGDICRYRGFIVNGALRMYSLNEKGQECVMTLALEGSWVNDCESYYLHLPTIYHIEATEQSELLLISHDQLILLIREVPVIADMIAVINEVHLINIQHRMHASINKTAKQRYLHLLETNPVLIQRFPLHIIASYLCMTSETLSRIRRVNFCVRCKNIGTKVC